MAEFADLIACPDCDLLQRRRPLGRGDLARCSRCAAVLYRDATNAPDRALAFTIASAVLFLVANAFPFMEFSLAQRVQQNVLASGVATLWSGGYPELAVMVGFTSIVAPATVIVALLALLAPLRLGRRPRYLTPLARLLGHIRPWAMMEVYLLAVLVAVVKLDQLADIELGLASYALVVLVFCLTAATAAFDPRLIWAATEDRR